MKPYNHTLKTLKFDISFYSEEHARDLQKQISKLSNSELYAIINKVCVEELNDKETFFLINKLEINLGAIPYTEVDQLLPVKLYQALGQTIRSEVPLQSKRYNYERQSVNEVSEHRHNEDLLFVFLQQGTLPWWMGDSAELESIFHKLLDDRPSELVAKVFTGDNAQSVIQRLIYQFSDNLLMAFAKTLNPTYAEPFIKYAAAFTKSTGLNRLGIRVDKNRQWGMLFAFLDPKISRPAYDEQAITEFILGRISVENSLDFVILLDHIECDFPGKDTLLSKNDAKRKIDKPKPADEGLRILKDQPAFAGELLKLKQPYGQLYENIIAFIKKYDPNWANANDLNAFAHDFLFYLQKKPPPDERANHILENALRKLGVDINNTSRKQDAQTAAFNLKQLQLLKYKVSDKEKQRKPYNDFAEAYFIDNAGLVLLNPYFSTLYEMLGLLKKKVFTDIHAKNKAIHLLQFLVDGQERHAEHLLLLNKILCGVNIEEPIQKEMTLNKKEKKTSLDLLNSTIGNWPKLNNSSIDTLRYEFLQRKGKLSFYGGEWVLRIEHNGRSDYLLNTIPWSFNMIKNSWMPEILRVEWI